MTDFSRLPQPFGRSEALRLGISARRLERALGNGHLIRLAESLYAVRSTWEALAPWVRHGHLARAAVRLTPDAIVSHLSHAVLLGLPHPAYEVSRVTMTVLDDVRTSRRDAWRTFHRGRTPPEHVMIRDGHPYLTATRTVIDCIRDLHPRDGLAIVDAALRAGLTTSTELTAMRRRQTRWPGIADADLVLPLGSPLRESWLESVSAWALHSRGYGVGVPQVNVFDPSGRLIGRVDSLWPELGIVGEADGRAKYELAPLGRPHSDVVDIMRRALHDQREREDRLSDVGLEVVRWGQQEALAVDPLAERFDAAVNRADPGRVTALFRCSCCRRALTDCPRPTVRAPKSA